MGPYPRAMSYPSTNVVFGSTNVGVARRVGHDLVEHDREEILPCETLEHARLIGHADGRIAVVDEQDLI